MSAIFTRFVGAVALCGALLAAVPAEAQRGPYRGIYRGGHVAYRGVAPRYGGYYALRGYPVYPRYYGYRGYPYPYHHHHNDVAIAIGAGLFGVLIGTAIAPRHYYYEAPPPPAMHSCPDGSMIPVAEHCAPEPMPPPPEVYPREKAPRG